MAITSLQFTRSCQDAMRCFVGTVHERENQLTKLLFLGDDFQTGGNLVNLREHKDAIRDTMCPGSAIENNNKKMYFDVHPQCHSRANKEREELHDKGCDSRRMS